MLTISKLFTVTTRHPNFSHRLCKPTLFCFFFFFPSSPFLPRFAHCASFTVSKSKRIYWCDRDWDGLQKRNPQMARSSMVAEYAKSNRSSCKTCSKTIESKTLRLGLVTKSDRGFDLIKWHHLGCFPLPSDSLASPEAIQGFSSLKSSDQEALKKLLAGQDKSQEKVHEATEDIQNELEENEESDSKRRKLCTSDIEAVVDINFSVSDVKSKYKDATLLPKWKAFQTVIFLDRDDGLHDSSKIAAFDFDGCLAKTALNRVGPHAWSLMYSSIPDKLRSLYNDGYKLVIFTNESNIERWKNKRQVAVDSKIGRLNNFIEKVNVPIQVFIACGLGKSGKADRKEDDPFRKPKPGMWQLMEQHFNSGISIDKDQLIFLPFNSSIYSTISILCLKFYLKY